MQVSGLIRGVMIEGREFGNLEYTYAYVPYTKDSVNKISTQKTEKHVWPTIERIKEHKRTTLKVFSLVLFPCPMAAECRRQPLLWSFARASAKEQSSRV